MKKYFCLIVTTLSIAAFSYAESDSDENNFNGGGVSTSGTGGGSLLIECLNGYLQTPHLPLFLNVPEDACNLKKGAARCILYFNPWGKISDAVIRSSGCIENTENKMDQTFNPYNDNAV